MFAIRRPKRENVASTDFRKVSELVHERRSERARNSETSRENPETAEAAVRTYRPRQHLRSLDRKTQELIVDAADIPRTWDSDSDRLAVSAQIEIPMRRDYLIVLGINVALTTIALSQILTPGFTDLLLFPCLAVASAIIVLIGSIKYFRRLRHLAWAGLAICALELGVFLVIIERLW